MEELEIVDTSCLGDVILRDKSGSEFVLVPACGEIRLLDDEERKLLSGLNEFIARMEIHGLKLGPGQCYGLKPYSIFKEYTPENMYVATMAEYVSFMGYFYGQTKDLPDGAKVKFKVVNQKAIQ